MIRGFKDRLVERLWSGELVTRYQAIRKQALRRLDILNAATRIEDLVRNPGNRLEALRGDRKGQFSIRINRQWRICFAWRDRDAFEVEITDYH